MEDERPLSCPKTGKPFVYYEELGYYVCPDCGMQTYDDDEEHCPEHEREKERQEHDARRDELRTCYWSFARPILPPVEVYIKGSSGHSKGRRKKPPKKNTYNIDEWATLGN